MDEVQWDSRGNLWGREIDEKEIIKALVTSNIEFTLHWGKNAAWDYPRLIDTKDDEWVDQ
ncbi:hypothetical protein FNH22_11550 [Fulvivirga sp. M361]|uniref:hypothetical protein n=1 Tax=Fulvivirga sp. M361 TaxID=2594266 RepID=UPI0011798A9F|nr:hypothetical protein [Fulvivirga sp. M361]TRX59151.1 hypothetical protein FNH22_11550 [Fulvivirga sp. M361]